MVASLSKIANNSSDQQSIIAKIHPEFPYRTDVDIVIVGAHMDSFSIHERSPNSSLDDYDNMDAPGADDNASSFSMLLEVARVISRMFAQKRVLNEVQFHFWAAEEIGLRGSRSVFDEYRRESRSVKAMLNFDMIGWPGKNLTVPGPRIAVHGNHIHQNLTAFTKKIVEAYSSANARDWSCRYKCSDHATAWENGFPSAALGESGFLDGEYPYLHTSEDKIAQLDLDYMLEVAKVAIGFLAELAYTNFTELNSRAGIN